MTYQHWPSTKFGSLRLWDDGVWWSDLEPSKGNFYWYSLDQYVNDSQATGNDILLELGQTPAWASSDPTAPSTGYGDGAMAPPANIQDWDDYITAVVTRYKGRIAAYEIWNEPFTSVFWTGSVQQMVQLSADAYRIIKSIDPQATVLSPSWDQYGLGLYLQAGGGQYVDAIAYHMSPTPYAPENVVQLEGQVRQVMSANGVGALPLWNTENSWDPPSTFSDDTASAYVARSLILNAALGVKRLYWYAWDNKDYVTLNLTDNNFNPTPAAYAYQQVYEWLAGASINCAADADFTWTCAVNNSGTPGLIVWNPNETVSVPTQGFKTETDLKGKVTDVSSSSSIQAGAMPVFLE